MGCGRRARMIKAVEGRRMPVGRQCSNLPIYHCLGDRRDAYKQLSPSTSAIFHTTHVYFADYDIYLYDHIFFP